MPRGGKRFKIPESTKKTAIDLVINAGKSISEVSNELGLNYKTVKKAIFVIRKIYMLT